MSETSHIPRKRQFKTNEVCRLTDTQPYILRFWESEFPQLKPDRRGGQPVYRRQDIDVVMRIKQLLYDEEYTIEGARRRLQQELDGEVDPATPAETAAEVETEPDDDEDGRPSLERAPLIEMSERSTEGSADLEMVERHRYDDAIDEIQHLQLRVQEFETALRKADQRARRAEERAEGARARSARVAERLEKLIDRLNGSS